MSFSNAFKDMANRARKGVIDILRTLWRLGDFSATIVLELFDAQIKPMLLYGSQIWGLQHHTAIEEVRLFALKKLLNLSPRTPNNIAYVKPGRYPLYIFSYILCIGYWLRLTKIDNFRLPKKACIRYAVGATQQ